MNETLEIRKQQLLSECRVSYASQRSKWWQSGPDDRYEFTWDIYVKKNYPRVFAEEIIIRNNKMEALTAFGICIGLGLPFALFMWNNTHSVFSLIFATILAIISILFYKYFYVV